MSEISNEEVVIQELKGIDKSLKTIKTLLEFHIKKVAPYLINAGFEFFMRLKDTESEGER